MNNTGIQYTGKVTVKVKNKPVSVRRNTGTSVLFNRLANILAGKYVEATVTRNYIPRYMMLINTEYSNIVSTRYNDYANSKLLLSEMPILTPKIEDDKCIFSCYLTTSNINKTMMNSARTNTTLLLIDGIKESILAYVEFDRDAISSVINAQQNDGQATITWDLSFSNSTN